MTSELQLISEQYEQGLITEEERYSLTVEAWRNIDKEVIEATERTHLARRHRHCRAWLTLVPVVISTNVKLATAMIGVMVDATGKEIELPIRSSFKKGLSPLEAFVATRGTRKGLIDTALKTADSGYLTRRLVDVSQDVFTVAEEAEDPGFTIYRTETEETMIEFGDRLYGRYAAEDVQGHIKAGELITREIADAIEADETISDS